MLKCLEINCLFFMILILVFLKIIFLKIELFIVSFFWWIDSFILEIIVLIGIGVGWVRVWG